MAPKLTLGPFLFLQVDFPMAFNPLLMSFQLCVGGDNDVLRPVDSSFNCSNFRINEMSPTHEMDRIIEVTPVWPL
jgi:hypothetical protein